MFGISPIERTELWASRKNKQDGRQCDIIICGTIKLKKVNKIKLAIAFLVAQRNQFKCYSTNSFYKYIFLFGEPIKNPSLSFASQIEPNNFVANK